MKLKNGAELKRQQTNKTTGERFVLGYLAGRATPWVTWAVDEGGYAYWGHYFCDENSAVLDLEKRVGNDIL